MNPNIARGSENKRMEKDEKLRKKKGNPKRKKNNSNTKQEAKTKPVNHNQLHQGGYRHHTTEKVTGVNTKSKNSVSNSKMRTFKKPSRFNCYIRPRSIC